MKYSLEPYLDNHNGQFWNTLRFEQEYEGPLLVRTVDVVIPSDAAMDKETALIDAIRNSTGWPDDRLKGILLSRGYFDSETERYPYRFRAFHRRSDGKPSRLLSGCNTPVYVKDTSLGKALDSITRLGVEFDYVKHPSTYGSSKRGFCDGVCPLSSYLFRNRVTEGEDISILIVLTNNYEQDRLLKVTQSLESVPKLLRSKAVSLRDAIQGIMVIKWHLVEG